MTPEVERLVRLMLLLPNGHHHELYKRLMEECGDAEEVMSMRWFVGDAAKMWPPAGPGNLASAVLTAFATPSQVTLSLLSDAITDEPTTGPGVGAVWVDQVRAAAIDVLAFAAPLEEVLTEAGQHWSLRG